MKNKKDKKCKDCGKNVSTIKTQRCQRCYHIWAQKIGLRKDKKNGMYKHGKCNLKYYCKDCGKKIHFTTGIYGSHRCPQCHSSEMNRNRWKNIEFKNLDDVIKPLIQPILDNENGIGKMRHNYIAHIQEEGRNFRIMMNDIVLEYNLPTDWASWSYFSGLAWYYYSLVDVNFKEQMDKAMELYEAKVGQPITNTLGFKMNEVISKMNNVFLPISLALEQHGLKTTFLSEDLELVKKKLQIK